MSQKYFHSELAYLREMGREFAAIHPSTAGLLAERGNDPDVERLLEGFAFLTARIRERVDDAVPGVVHSMAQLLLPHYLRPFPATTIVEFEPALKGLRGVHRIPAGSLLGSRTVAGTQCTFQTTAPVDLLPLQITHVELDDSSAKTPRIRLGMRTTDPGRRLLARREGIRFHLHGDSAVVTMLLLWLFRYCSGGRFNVRGEPVPGGRISPDDLKPTGFSPEESLVPWPEFAFDGYRVIQEYFCLPAKFHGFQLEGLEDLELPDNEFEIELHFDRPPAFSQRLRSENFRLHCTPVVNLFPIAADPIVHDPLVHEHLVRAAGLNPHHMEVFEVETVTGLQSGRPPRPYRPFFGFEHALESRDETAYYVMRRASSPLDQAYDTYLSLATPRDGGGVQLEETLSIELLCSNRDLPVELQLGDISVNAKGANAPAPFRNILPITPPVRPSLDGELHWRLLTHLAVNRSSLTRKNALPLLLSLYNVPADSMPQQSRANSLRIEAIREVRSTAVTRLLEGAPVRGLQIDVEVDGDRFDSPGEAFLFGMVLDELFAARTGLNSFNEFVMTLHPSKERYRWKPRIGRHTMA